MHRSTIGCSSISVFLLLCWGVKVGRVTASYPNVMLYEVDCVVFKCTQNFIFSLASDSMFVHYHGTSYHPTSPYSRSTFHVKTQRPILFIKIKQHIGRVGTVTANSIKETLLRQNVHMLRQERWNSAVAGFHKKARRRICLRRCWAFHRMYRYRKRHWSSIGKHHILINSTNSRSHSSWCWLLWR